MCYADAPHPTPPQTPNECRLRKTAFPRKREHKYTCTYTTSYPQNTRRFFTVVGDSHDTHSRCDLVPASGRIIQRCFSAVWRRPGHGSQADRQAPQHVHDRNQTEPRSNQRHPPWSVHEKPTEKRNARQQGGERIAHRAPGRVYPLLWDHQEPNVEQGLSGSVNICGEVHSHYVVCN